jgi:citrate synthase
MKRNPIKSDIAWSAPDRVLIHGHDLCRELVGKVDFGQMAFLQIFARMPKDAKELRMFNAVMVILVEHGITPSALSTRLTLSGAPESVQAAVAAGLLGLGSVFVGSLDQAARLLQQAIPDSSQPGDLEAIASQIVDDYMARKAIIPGIGHPFHKPIDPRTGALFAVARDTGFYGPYADLIILIGQKAEQRTGKVLPVNVTAAMAAVTSQMGLSWRYVRGLAVAARAIGLVGHIIEEMRQPMAGEIYMRIEEEAGEHLAPKP